MITFNNDYFCLSEMNNININDYDYDLPADRIAQFPVVERDASRLLVYRNNKITSETFRNITEYLPKDSMLVFNNTKVIRARLLFRKESGALIEILCLEPLSPFDYISSFSSTKAVEWKCIVGNLKKWKSGLLAVTFEYKEKQYILNAEKINAEGDAWRIKFTWNSLEITFADVIESTGRIPLPPYISREERPEDSERYQTVYSRIKGSVAAPTAGLHFTKDVLNTISQAGIAIAEITLHVGAGTFQPVKSESILEHDMHCEHFSVEKSIVESLPGKLENIIAVGTTSVRTLESLYWLGVKLLMEKPEKGNSLTLDQWEAYNLPQEIGVKDSIDSLIKYMKVNGLNTIDASTSIIIIPGYKFRFISGIVTNFHQPRSTLLLLISAWTGEKWKELYNFALENNFRFLSYGDSSLLLR
jgi:S-adenosylmethionine:tRNA ribosyltransferase-isomerase